MLDLKTLDCVGWVEERNPTFSAICWVSLGSTQPTIIVNPSVLPQQVSSVFLKSVEIAASRYILYPAATPIAGAPRTIIVLIARAIS
ncbi:hypothetical protein [Nostoc sp.]|uniref:hypothetical protein n=1 Tax=Nostoc sp. TaxID=1180 RepID=UPI002FFC3107